MFFSQVTRGAPPGEAYHPPPTIGAISRVPSTMDSDTSTGGMVSGGEDSVKLVRDHMKVNSIIRSYQVREVTQSLADHTRYRTLWDVPSTVPYGM